MYSSDNAISQAITTNTIPFVLSVFIVQRYSQRKVQNEQSTSFRTHNIEKQQLRRDLRIEARFRKTSQNEIDDQYEIVDQSGQLCRYLIPCFQPGIKDRIEDRHNDGALEHAGKAPGSQPPDDS